MRRGHWSSSNQSRSEYAEWAGMQNPCGGKNLLLPHHYHWWFIYLFFHCFNYSFLYIPLPAPHHFLLQASLSFLHEQQFHNDGLFLRVHHTAIHLESIHQVGSPGKKSPVQMWISYIILPVVLCTEQCQQWKCNLVLKIHLN